MYSKLRKKMVEFGKKHHWILFLARKARFCCGRSHYLKYYLTARVDAKIIVFESFMGRQFSCSPKALYQKMLTDARFSEYTFVWIFKEIGKYAFLETNRRTKVIKYGSSEYYKAYATAKYWITNSRINEIIKKKQQQIFIQCWHGTPLKKLGYDITVQGGNAMNSVKDIRYKYRVDSARYTYMISPSAFCSERYISAFSLKDNSIIVEKGYPRNDFLYNYTQDDVLRVRQALALPDDKKVILYAPTWRDDQHVSNQGYTYTLQLDFSRLQKRYANDYVILFRTHYFISNIIDLSQYAGFVYNVSQYEDINDLYIVSDLLITDYSSVFFDYANLKRPILFYMYDFTEYKNNIRDFYIDLTELPGPLTKNEDELITELDRLPEYFERFAETYDNFNKKFTYLDDGQSSKRVIEKCILNCQ